MAVATVVALVVGSSQSAWVDLGAAVVAHCFARDCDVDFLAQTGNFPCCFSDGRCRHSWSMGRCCDSETISTG
jgi:hypothetical protein